MLKTISLQSLTLHLAGNQIKDKGEEALVTTKPAPSLKDFTLDLLMLATSEMLQGNEV